MTKNPALYFVTNAMCWFFLVLFTNGLSTGVAVLVLANVLLLALLVIYTNSFNRVKYLELLDTKSPFLNNKKNFSIKFLLTISPLLGLVSVYIYLFALTVGAFVYLWEYFLLTSSSIRRLTGNRTTLAALEKYEPTVCAYVSGTAESAYQINMWLEVLEKLPQKTIILIRDRNIYLGMRETNLPVVFASTIDEVFAVFDTGIRCALYPANGQKNAPAFRYSQVIHCFINHGESDKGVNHSKFLMAYDKLFLSGPRALDRMLEANLPVRDTQVEFVGRPQLEFNLEKRKGTSITKILYAPTWEGFVESEDYTSIDTVGLELIKSLQESGMYEVTFRPHPFIGRRSKKAAKAIQRVTRYCKANALKISMNQDESIYQAMNNCDLMLTDISSILTDFLYTEKPIIFCRGIEPNEMQLKEMNSLQAAYMLENGEDVTNLIDSIKRKDSLSATRVSITSDYIVNSGVGSFEKFVQAVENHTHSS